MSSPRKSTSHSTKPDDKKQSRQFIETAREVGADEGASRADELLGKLAKLPPEPRPSKVKK